MLRKVEEKLDTLDPLETDERAFLEESMPDLLIQVDKQVAGLRWWIERVDWLEAQVRVKDFPPGWGHPNGCRKDEFATLTLKEMCECGQLQWPADRVREVYGAVV
jgi:hypothetical protein